MQNFPKEKDLNVDNVRSEWVADLHFFFFFLNLRALFFEFYNLFVDA